MNMCSDSHLHKAKYCCNDISDTLIKFDIKAISGSDSVRMTVLLTDACAKCRNRRADHLIRIQQEPGLRRNNFIFHQIRWLATYSQSLLLSSTDSFTHDSFSDSVRYTSKRKMLKLEKIIE